MTLTSLPAAAYSGTQTLSGTYTEQLKTLLVTARQHGVPARDRSGVFSAEAARSLCALRELLTGTRSRSKPTLSEIASLYDRLGAQPSFSAPAGSVDGFNVSVRCQVGYFVTSSVVQRAVALSSGKASTPTGIGLFRVGWQVNGWKESTLFPGAWMYKPSFFNGGEGVHGMSYDSLVKPYPASHGCVRVLRADMDWLFPRLKAARVRVYGSW